MGTLIELSGNQEQSLMGSGEELFCFSVLLAVICLVFI